METTQQCHAAALVECSFIGKVSPHQLGAALRGGQLAQRRTRSRCQMQMFQAPLRAVTRGRSRHADWEQMRRRSSSTSPSPLLLFFFLLLLLPGTRCELKKGAVRMPGREPLGKQSRSPL
eukprot:985709-Pyramimonas_sp.AAC.1